MKRIQISELAKKYFYDPVSGDIVSARTGRAVRTSKKAGRTRYIQCAVNGEKYQGHRIAWALFHKQWPEGLIDHINGIGTDNRIDNLRVCTHAENLQNCRVDKRSTSGVRGVAWIKHRRMWRARICINKKVFYLGLFETIEEASRARRKAEIELLGKTCEASMFEESQRENIYHQ